jgi:hypothetical protein
MCITTPTFPSYSHSQAEGRCSPAAELNLPSKHAIARRRHVNLTTLVLKAAFSAFSVTPHCDALSSHHAAMADFDLFAGDFQFTDFSNFNAAPILDTSMPSLSQPQQPHYPLPTTYAPQPNAISPINYDDSSKKRKADDMSVGTPIQHLDEHARVAAEEDKRRRNTAASARFRVKKKQREQALEKTAKDMSDRVQQLEARIGQLETENTWLKSLITEKNVGKSSSSELKAMLSEHEKQKAGRSSPAHTEGVGTKA